ncbi:MAG TPA: alpha-amylase family glycosyl hydrolase [Dermatophilaceae bacterium]|jgi:cyclomaltodextrinase|nr:alpha-amylase [Actinomycetales bacterium]HMT32846.1 alpha-amylase family glycosyl hydrolase [Dermatophilaceae bacterium]HMT90194.1 alpha-amylase family glycosyl hydrolase [Dermatophilaceae bacterium]
MADWVQHSIWWQVYPLGALGADPTGQDRRCHRSLRDLIPWLDHLVTLGANGLALGPIFQSTSHGYDTLDYFAIDERLGTLADFRELVVAAKQRGIRIMLDGVFNHVGRDHPAVRDPAAAIASGWAKAARGDTGAPALHTFEGHGGLVTLDHDNPAVRDLIVEVMTHWLAEGVDAWRLDAAYAMAPQAWAAILTRVRAAHPEVYIVGEVIHGDYPAIVAESGMDAVTQYELWKAIWSSITDGNMHELAWSLQRHDAFLEHFVPWTFIGNHDVTRIATLLPPEGAAIAAVLLATLPGTPAVYYGDELGWTGLKEERFGGDDAIRPALPATPAELGEPPAIWHLYCTLLGLRRRNPTLYAARVRVLHVSHTTLLYAVDSTPVVTVAVNAAAIPQRVPAVPGDVVGSVGALRDVDGVNLDPWGWLVTSGE